MASYRDTVLNDGPEAYWRLGEDPGASTAADETANNYNGSYEGTVTLGQFDAIPSDSDTGGIFDNGDVTATGILPTSQTTFALELWAEKRQNRLQTPLEIFADDYGSTIQRVFVGIESDGRVHVRVRDDDGLRLEAKTKDFPLNSGVHHLVVNFDPANDDIAVVVDGSGVALDFLHQETPANFSADLVETRLVLGDILAADEVALYPNKLTDAQISDHIAASGNLLAFAVEPVGTHRRFNTYAAEPAGVAKWTFVAFAVEPAGTHRRRVRYAAEPTGTHRRSNTYAAEPAGVYHVVAIAAAIEPAGTHLVRNAYAAEPSGTHGIFGGFAREAAGMHRVANADDERYELFRGVDGSPDFSSPWETFASLPHTTAALTAGNTYHFVLRKRNRFGLSSENLIETLIEVDANGNEVTPAPSAPRFFTVESGDAKKIHVEAAYSPQADADNVAADTWAVWWAVGSDPDLTTAPDYTESMRDFDGTAKLVHDIDDNFAEGDTVHVVVRTRRSSDTADSTNDTAKTAEATAAGPSEPSGDAVMANVHQPSEY